MKISYSARNSRIGTVSDRGQSVTFRGQFFSDRGQSVTFRGQFFSDCEQSVTFRG